MKPELKSKFIQYLNLKNNNEGFTLIELLAVIILIGILAAIALPNFLNQDVKAKQAEAKQNVVLINKAQNSFRAENSSFASSFDLLAVGVVTGSTTGSTTNYSYTIAGNIDTATIVASPIDTALRGYSGADTRFSNAASQSVIGTVLCETRVVGNAATAPATPIGVTPTCVNATEKTISL